jgi:hypothetical protein
VEQDLLIPHAFSKAEGLGVVDVTNGLTLAQAEKRYNALALGMVAKWQHLNRQEEDNPRRRYPTLNSS